MAKSDTYSGKDVVEIDGRHLTGFADGDVAVLSFPNQKISKFSGDDGNTITVANAAGTQAQLQLRILQNSRDYQYLKMRMAQQDYDLASMLKLTGRFTKITGDELGNITKDTVNCYGGNFTNGVQFTKGTNGNVEENVAIFTILFSRSE
jgi:hypothetical protein